ncbi:hypothetical protein GCM10027517_26550 [Phycicoccus ginsengisoli]
MEPAHGRQTADTDAGAGADALYPGDRAGLRAVHDAVVMLAQGLGDDTHRADYSRWVSVGRRATFAVVGPGAGATVRVGLSFPADAPADVSADDRLSPATGFGPATHWLELSADCDEDDIRSLEPLLEAAYLQNG